MASSKSKSSGQANVPGVPPFYVADVPLPVGSEMGDGGPRAFNPGDPVSVEHVEQFGWRDYVSEPEGDWSQPADSTPAGGSPAGSSSESGQAGNGEDDT